MSVWDEFRELRGVRSVITAVKCSLAAQHTVAARRNPTCFYQHKCFKEAFSVTKPTQAGTTGVKRLLTEASE